MNLYYNRSNRGGAGYYNGNIQGETWGITSYLNQVNSYTYDKLNRITGSRFGAGNAYRSYYTYDNNGNIQKLLRKAEDGVAFIDSIFYGYKINSNQLDYTRDDAGNAPGWDFPGTLPGSNHYQYDANGNMTRDDYKAINVSYNSFNLPSEIDFGNNQKLNYHYDGSGKKLTKVNTPAGYYPTNTEYRGQMVHQYSNGTGSLKYIITSEGRLLNTGTNAAPVWGWEYDLKDHLGNVRVIFKPNATNNGVVRVEYANYFPFGMKMLAPYSTFSGAKYLYNGKEMQDDFGLNWYDYWARFYDAAIGRTPTIDPHAENYYNESTYSFLGNNPLRYIDPTGMDWIEDKKGNVAWYKDINQDNVPKGYKYIGTEYQGITINTYNAYADKSDNKYLKVEISFSDSDSKGNSYNWVQTVERDGSGQPFVDYDSETKDGQANYPYYQDRNENLDARKDGYDITYFDNPSETHKSGSFNAELSLIGDPIGIQKGNHVFAPNAGVTGKNIYVPKITLNYGFSVKNGVMTVSPIRVVKPSPFHIQTINQIK